MKKFWTQERKWGLSTICVGVIFLLPLNGDDPAAAHWLLTVCGWVTIVCGVRWLLPGIKLPTYPVEADEEEESPAPTAEPAAPDPTPPEDQ